MKVAIITDTHLGGRGDSSAFNRYFFKFYDEVFFPYLEEHGIKTLFHLGDVVDRRKFINYGTLKDLRERFVNRLGADGIDTHILVGNHDSFFKNTNRVNAMTELFSSFDGEHEPWVYPDPTEIDLDGLKVLLVPWICDENREAASKLIESTTAEVVFGHLELIGFEMHKGFSNATGADAAVFSKFDMVLSGHYHHKSDNGTVFYLGAPYEMTWIDYEDPRGFHIFDTDTRELEYIRNPNRMFLKLPYDDLDKTFEEVLGVDWSKYESATVKVVVVNKVNPYWFDMFLDKLYKANPGSVSIIEDFTETLLNDDMDMINQAEDTMTIVTKYIDGLPLVHRNSLKKLMHGLHTEAMTMDIE